MVSEISFDGLPLFLRVQDICQILQIGRSTAYDLLRCGKIPSIRVGRQIRIPRESVKALLEATDS